MGSHSYDIIFDEAQDDREFRGTFSDRRHKVLLNPNLHHQQLRVTLWHELLHLLCEVNDVRPPEADIDRLSEGIVELLVRSFGIDFDFGEVPVLERSNKEG